MKTKELVSWIETHPGCTWADLNKEFDKSMYYLSAALRRDGRTGLQDIVDRNSGYKRHKPYAKSLVEVLTVNPDVSWSELAWLFAKTETQLRATLYASGNSDLVKGRAK